MLRLRIGATARADLTAIRRYSVREFGSDVADVYFRGFGKAFDLLRAHPFAGTVRHDIGAGALVYVYRRHRILYRVENELIVIVRILYHAQSSPANQ
ncbi:type II toxin-antitoxin system RelE/ParE family toxin [uncultured Sphingomonas sp.]|uniref:type II toxin-antitoxin system RelE/ParE family toxin n=1 Tax=uncultured Sphingomonas sp. TaxID=158754 RepID=UPI0035CBBCC7